jgi:hypothetical protein
MIEKRTMAVVESSHRVAPILAMYDTEKQEVVCYQYAFENEENNDDEWYHAYENERYFNTLQEANEYVAKRQEYLRSKFSEVMEFIDEMDRVDSNYFKFDKEEYLGDYAKDDTPNWLRRERDAYRAEASLLNSIARSRHFNVNGETINIDEVVRVMWHEEDKATLVMRDGHEVTTFIEAEHIVVVDMFGSNRSKRTCILR